MVLSLPTEDRVRSPHTGWTRAHWVAVADHWLLHLRRYASPDRAFFDVPGRTSGSGVRSDGLEAFARSMLLAAHRIATGDDPHDYAGWYAEGLAAGVAKEWPRADPCVVPMVGTGQPTVEAANIALALRASRGRIWDRLDAVARERLVDWLGHHARLPVWPNNWQLFPAACEAFLGSVGADLTGCRGAAGVAVIEGYHQGGGWYLDGAGRNVDHYLGWAIHPFLGMWYAERGTHDELAAWRTRLASFVADFARTFAPDGRMLHQGRSLTYRTASLASLWLAESEGVSPLAPGETRRLASGLLRYFTDLGVGVDRPVSLGWGAADYLPLTQSYSGPGSPYFAAVGFAGLGLPDDHPVWTEVEPEPDRAPFTRPLPAVGWLVHGAGDGVVRLVNHGSDHASDSWNTPTATDPDDPHYAKFGYSTHTAPGTGAAFDDAVDGHLALLRDGLASRRGRIRGHLVDGDLAASWHVPQRDGTPWDAVVVTASVVDAGHEVRCHWVTCAGTVGLREGGHAVAGDSVTTGDGAARAADGLVSAVVPLHGWTRAGTVWQNGCNAFGPAAAAPYLTGEVTDEGVFVADHRLGFATTGPVTATVDGTVVTVTFPSGRTRAVDLAALFDLPSPG
ncbi:DUF2264 domain-containing protein [Longispora sp. K20-0274]|uniref:DUF2264 domain-containing protein n=1 Tax=Longispora sp. K20-0274 TaxID=3088255 RepID=UPI003999DE69